MPREHGEEPVRAARDAQHPDLAHARICRSTCWRRATARSAACRSAYQAESPVLGLVLPSNSPGVHTLWLPIIPLQIGLVLKPGPQEPWTPYRMAEAFFQAGIPREAISIYPGEGDVGAAVLDSVRPQPDLRRHSRRSIAIAAIRKVQAHGPGFSKILLGDDQVDRVGTASRPDGRERLRQQRPRLHQLLRHLGQPSHARDRRRARRNASPRCGRCRPIIPRQASRRSPCPARRTRSPTPSTPTCKQPGVTDVTADVSRRRRASSSEGRAEYLLPTVVHCDLARRGDREEGIHVPVRHASSSVRKRRCSRRSGRRWCARRSPATRVPPPAARRHAHRSAESRTGADDSA